jgi:hypothetical protein
LIGGRSGVAGTESDSNDDVGRRNEMYRCEFPGAQASNPASREEMEMHLQRTRSTDPRLGRTSATSAVLVATVLAGCADAGGARGAGESLRLVSSQTLVTTESELVGGVYDLTVAPDGDVYIADYGFKHVLVVSPDGSVRRTIGKEGSGPGEFSMPYIVSVGADSLRVLDAGSDRVQVFDLAGMVARDYRLEEMGVGGGRDFRDDGFLAAAIDGSDNAMVRVLDAVGTRVGMFGEPVAPPVQFYDFTALKSEIRDGRVPDAFRNRATVAWAADHSLYLAFLAEPEVRRYDAEGTLRWTRTLDEPVLRSAREAFFRKNTEELNPSAIHPLQYVTDAAVVGNDFWLLLNTTDEDDGLLLVLGGQDGAVLRRFTFPGLPNTGFFAVDPSRQRLYMAPRDEASVLVFELPGF